MFRQITGIAFVFTLGAMTPPARAADPADRKAQIERIIYDKLGSEANVCAADLEKIVDSLSVADEFVAKYEKIDSPVAWIGAIPALSGMTPVQRLSVFKQLLARGKYGPVAVWSPFLDDEQKLSVYEALAKAMPMYSVIAVPQDRKLTREHMVRLIHTAIDHARIGTLEYLFAPGNYRLRPSALWTIGGPIKVIAYVTKALTYLVPGMRQKMAVGALDRAKQLTAEDRQWILRRALQIDPLSVMMVRTNAAIRVDGPLHSDSVEGDLAGVIENFATGFPDLFPAAWKSIALDGVGTREMAFGLIRELYRLSDGAAPWVVPENALDVLARAAGLDYAVMKSIPYTRETRARLFDTLLQTQERLSSPAYANVAIAPELLSDKRLATLGELFSQFKFLLFLRGDGEAAWQEIRREFLAERALTVGNVAEVSDRVRAAVAEGLEKVLRAASPDEKYRISLAEFRSLESKWLDTDVVFSLVARFNAIPGWRPENLVMSKLLRAEIDGRAWALKRFGDPDDPADREKARAQLAMLKTEAQQLAWWDQWSEAAIYDPGRAAPASPDEVPNVAEISRRAGKLVTAALAQTFPEDANAVHDEDLVRAVLRSREQIPKTLRQLGIDAPGRIQTLGRALLTELRANRWDPSEMAKAIAYLKYLTREVSIHSNQINDTTLANAAMNDALRLLKPLKNQNSADVRELVVTVTSHELRTALNLGGLVDAGSCMNPEYGARADAIPALGLDANVQAIFSTALDADDFASPEDFAEVMAAFARNPAPSIAFDGARDIYTFRLHDGGREISTTPTNIFYRRHQLKVGAGAKDVPVVRTERPFTQSHAAHALMREQTESIKKRMAAAMGGKVDVKMRHEASRNLPGGSYSDAMMLATGSGQTTGAVQMPFVVFPEGKTR